MAESYDDLKGAEGRRVNFRPRRYRRRALVGDCSAGVSIGGESGRLADLSLTGASCFVSDAQSKVSLGAVLPITIHIAGEPAVAGQAEVVRRTDVNGATKLAVRFLDTLARPSAIRSVRDRARLRAALEHGTTEFNVVPQIYREACQRAVLVLRYWKQLAERHCTEETGLESERFPTASLSRDELAILDSFRLEWGRVRDHAAAGVEAVLKKSAAFWPAKRLTELLVTPLVLESPIWRRAYEKPLGYPGDFELMEYMYDAKPRGESAFARILHQLGREERLAATVNSRKDLLVSWLHRKAQEKYASSERTLSVLSVGSGPSREISQFVGELKLDVALDVVLVDQDESALAESYEKLVEAAVARGVAIHVRCRHISFHDLFARPDLVTELEGRDLVFSAGLFDYLQDAGAAVLARELYAVVRSGGALLVGNAADHPTVKWVPEFILDWHMVYRTEAELYAMTRGLPQGAERRVLADESGAWHFLCVTKESVSNV